MDSSITYVLFESLLFSFSLITSMMVKILLS